MEGLLRSVPKASQQLSWKSKIQTQICLQTVLLDMYTASLTFPDEIGTSGHLKQPTFLGYSQEGGLNA